MHGSRLDSNASVGSGLDRTLQALANRDKVSSKDLYTHVETDEEDEVNDSQSS